MLYVGETKRRLGNRFAEHLRTIKDRKLAYPVAKHFCSSPHVGVSDVSVTVLMSTNGDDSDRHKLEQRTIYQLGTLAPAGMNIQFNAFPLSPP